MPRARLEPATIDEDLEAFKLFAGALRVHILKRNSPRILDLCLSPQRYHRLMLYLNRNIALF